jgi:hypothetical protein
MAKKSLFVGMAIGGVGALLASKWLERRRDDTKLPSSEELSAAQVTSITFGDPADRAVAVPLRLCREMGREHGFPAPTLLRIDDDGLHDLPSKITRFHDSLLATNLAILLNKPLEHRAP